MLFAPISAQQGLILVDGTGGTPEAFRSITAAVNSSAPGDTIYIRGLEMSGVPFGYADIVHPAFWSTQDAETFPIHLKPGMTLKPLDSTPVYVWSAATGGPPEALFVADPGSSGVPTHLVDLHLAGGIAGVKITGAAGSSHDVLLEDLRFSWHTIGLDVQGRRFLRRTDVAGLPLRRSQARSRRL